METIIQHIALDLVKKSQKKHIRVELMILMLWHLMFWSIAEKQHH